MNKEALRKELEYFYAEVITFCEQEGIWQEDRDRKWYAKKVKDFGDECIDELINKIEMSNEQLHPLFKSILEQAALPITTRLAALDDGPDLDAIQKECDKVLTQESVDEYIKEHPELFNKKDLVDDGQEGKGLDAGMEAMRLFDKWLFEQGYRYQTNVMTTKEGSTDLVPVQMGLWYLPGMSVGGRRTSDLLNEFLKTTPLPLADGEGEKVREGIEYKTEFEMRIHFTSENEISETEFVYKILAALQDGKSYILISPIQPLPSAVTGGVKEDGIRMIINWLEVQSENEIIDFDFRQAYKITAKVLNGRFPSEGHQGKE